MRKSGQARLSTHPEYIAFLLAQSRRSNNFGKSLHTPAFTKSLHYHVASVHIPHICQQCSWYKLTHSHEAPRALQIQSQPRELGQVSSKNAS